MYIYIFIYGWLLLAKHLSEVFEVEMKTNYFQAQSKTHPKTLSAHPRFYWFSNSFK